MVLGLVLAESVRMSLLLIAMLALGSLLLSFVLGLEDVADLIRLNSHRNGVDHPEAGSKDGLARSLWRLQGAGLNC